MTEVWHFTVSVEYLRPQYEDGNEALYSENGMAEGKMWRIKFGPVSDNTLAGTCGLVRVSDGQAMPSLWPAAEWALKRIFTEARSIGPSNKIEIPCEYSDTMMQNIAFTLRGIGMEKCCGYVDSNGPWEVVTHDQVTHYESTGQGVHGLISSTNEVTLNEAAIYLADKFGPDLVRWVGRCTNPGRWQNSW